MGVSLYRWLILVALVSVLLAFSITIRHQLDLQWSLRSIREFVENLGYWGPVAYIGVLTFRFLFLIPSGLLLLSGGLLFGALDGTLYAGLGLTGSGALKYALVSIVGQGAFLRQLPDQLQRWVAVAAHQRMSAWALTGIGAYPVIPKHVFQLAAILSGMSAAAYLSAVVVGSFLRAATFCYMGGAIYSSNGVLLAAAPFVAVFLLPLVVKPLRVWLMSPFVLKVSPHRET